MFLLWLRKLPQCGDWTPASVPPLRTGPVLLTLLFSPLVPSSYQVFRGSIYSFPLVRYSCPLSAGVLHVLLCLKVSSWCICGESCTPRPPTLLPSCSQGGFFDWFVLAVQGTQESSLAPQFESINSLLLSFLYGPTLTSVLDYWKNQHFDYMDLCQQSDVFVF